MQRKKLWPMILERVECSTCLKRLVAKETFKIKLAQWHFEERINVYLMFPSSHNFNSHPQEILLCPVDKFFEKLVSSMFFFLNAIYFIFYSLSFSHLSPNFNLLLSEDLKYYPFKATFFALLNFTAGTRSITITFFKLISRIGDLYVLSALSIAKIICEFQIAAFVNTSLSNLVISSCSILQHK